MDEYIGDKAKKMMKDIEKFTVANEHRVILLHSPLMFYFIVH